MRLLSKNWVIFLILLILAFVNSYIFGLSRLQGWGDAIEYSAYAKNLITTGTYSLDGVNFSSFREPGYPLTLFLAYLLFGIETPLSFLAVKISQIFMLSISGFLAFKILTDLFYSRKLGIITGALTVLMPYYGYYAGDISTEMPFAFSLILSFYLILKIIKSDPTTSDFIVLAFTFTYAVLTRAQLLFFPFILLIGGLALHEKIGADKLKGFFISILLFSIITGGWASLVFYKTDHFAITNGRQQFLIYYRAVRSELSYGDLSRYLYAWIKRSVTGGKTSEFLDRNEFKYLNEKYSTLNIKNETQAQLMQAENIKTIIKNFDRYLFGNIIEFVKLTFMEHTYAGSFNRYGRAGFYVLLYSLFINGLIQFVFYRQKIFRSIFWFSLIFLAYNVLIITALDAIPRYNTPYLFFYLIVGILGSVNIWPIKILKTNQE